LVELGFELRALTCKAGFCMAGTLLLELHLKSILFWLFLEMGSLELFARAALKLWSSRSQPPNN
jgi:hypothetical protein